MTKAKTKSTTKKKKQECSAGFDNPVVSQEHDLLEREGIANQVYSYLTDIDADWSVRVGLIAPWGEGKTTIAEWVAARAITEDHIAVWWRNPWTAKTDAELWLGFYTALTTALSNQGVEFKSSLKHIGAALSSNNLVESASTIHGYAQAGLGFVQAATRITAEDIKKIQAELKGKRVIVIVDDLDRVDAALIPRLLMSIRDVMNIQGFSFLLPFDERVVSEALKAHIQAEGYGERFLEKILDYRVYLYPPSEEQISSFFRTEIQQHCPFINIEMLEGLDEFLPGNPRKLKALARSLKLFRVQGERHRADEIDWKSVIFAQMIKMESEPFFRIFCEDTFGKKENLDPDNRYKSNPWMFAAMEKNEDKAQKEERERLNKLLLKADINVPETKDRLIHICEGWQTCQGYWNLNKIFYALRLLDKPETLTWAEFEEAWEIWSKAKKLDDLASWINRHAEKMKKTKAEIACEFIKTTTQRYDEFLARASDVLLESDHKTCLDDATEVLRLIDLIIDSGFSEIPQEETLGVEVFKSFYQICSKWAHFQGNETDRALRKQERSCLEKWVGKVNERGNVVPYTVFLKNLRRSGFNEKQTLQLREDILSGFNLDADSSALKALETPGGVDNFYPYDAGLGIKNRLLDVTSSLWTSEDGASAPKVFEKANENSAIQLNAYEFLRLLEHSCIEGTWGLERKEIAKFFEHPNIIEKIWEAATVTPFQFRALSSVREVRQNLISRGIDEKLLPVPEWLVAETEDETDPRKAA